MAAVPSIGRASGVERRPTAPEADATRALYERYSRQILNYCVHQLNSREEAEDAVQTTFMNAFRGLKRGIVPEAEQAWLFKIAENVCLSRRRSSWRRGKVESPNDFEVLQEIVPSKHANRADELIGLEDALEAMAENQRRAILLREWQGLSYREIADELELSQAAVETLIFRARRSLASGLESPVTPKKRRRISAAFDGVSVGSLIASLKSILTGGAAIKAVAVAVAAGSATVAATQGEPALVDHFQQPAKPAQTVHVTKQSHATFSPQASLVARQSGMSVTQAHAKADRGYSLHAVAPSHPAGFGKAPTEDGTQTQTPSTTPVAPAPVVPVAPATPATETPVAATPPAAQPKSEPASNGNGNQRSADAGAKADPPKADPAKTDAPKTEPAKSNNGKGNNDKAKIETPHAATVPAAGPQATAAPVTPLVVAPTPTGNGDKAKNSDRKAGTSTAAAAAPVAPPVTDPSPVTAPPAAAASAPTHGNDADKGKGKGK